MNKKTITSAFILLLMLALGLPNPVYAGEAAPKLNQILGESSADVNYVVSDLDSRSAEYWQGVLDERERKEAERKWKEAERKRKEAERKRKEAERNKPSGPGISPEQREKDVDKDLANDKKKPPTKANGKTS